MSKCDLLLKLVLKDMPITQEATGTALAKCLSNLFKIEDLQIVNCGLSPRSLVLIAKELEPIVQLENLSLAGNVLRKHPSNK